ncbi:MAG TPA: glycosyl hydrolase family 8 [Polyangiaceae bacterium]|jgi:endo-1,4-beta-D-glucanase Y
MKRHLSYSFWLALTAVGAWSCSAGAPASLDDSVDDSAPAGGSTGQAGGSGIAAANSGLTLAAGGPHPFPVSQKPANCSLTTAAGAPAAVQSAYNLWKSQYVTAGGAGTALRVVRPQNQNDTVSEGIGYGMLASVYMADRQTFDGLWAYAKSHFDGNGLMTWQINSSNAPIGMGSALDGDEDMAWALLQASDQWNDASYLNDAISVINAILNTTVAGDGLLRPGDNWGGSPKTFPDYFSPAYYRVFALVTNNKNWSGAVIDRNYTLLSNVSGTYGLVPDASNASSQPDPMTPNYTYDACRTPWRIGMDYCFNGEMRAKAYLDKVAAFFNSQGAVSNIGDGYTTSGTKTSSYPNMAFIGPAGVSGMAGTQTLLDGAFAYGATGNGGTLSYFAQSLRVVTMMMMSGNFVDFTKP